MKTIKFDCKENDNRIHINTYDGGKIDEIHFGTSLKKEGMVVIGINDLKSALRESGYDIVKKPSFVL